MLGKQKDNKMKKNIIDTLIIIVISSFIQFVYRNFNYLIDVIEGSQSFNVNDITWSISIVISSVILFWMLKLLNKIQEPPDYNIEKKD